LRVCRTACRRPGPMTVPASSASKCAAASAILPTRRARLRRCSLAQLGSTARLARPDSVSASWRARFQPDRLAPRPRIACPATTARLAVHATSTVWPTPTVLARKLARASRPRAWRARFRSDTAEPSRASPSRAAVTLGPKARAARNRCGLAAVRTIGRLGGRTQPAHARKNTEDD